MHLRARNALFTVAGLAALVFASPARAELFLDVLEDGVLIESIQDNVSPLDINPNLGQITVDTAALNPLLLNFVFDALGATSNNAPIAGFLTPAVLTQTYGVSRTEAFPDVSMLTIRALEDSFNFPTGDPKFLANAAGGAFTGTSDGDSESFQSFFDGTPSPLLFFPAPAGTGPFDYSGSNDLALGDRPTPFALLNESILTLGPVTDPMSPPTAGFDGRTVVTAIPEPASLSLLLLGLSLPFAHRYLRRGRLA
jgi:hypothetical protein